MHQFCLGGGVLRRYKSPDFRSLEVGISSILAFMRNAVGDSFVTCFAD